jgi:NAD(P)H-dependent flavin oxidoreductase YrpB (nitropropane dioxygenase family)
LCKHPWLVPARRHLPLRSLERVVLASDGGIGTLALVPQVVDMVAIPVVAAGGISDARGIAAALALGAAGVQLGTAFLRCPEAEIDTPRRARLDRATDTDTIVTSMVSGRANRVATGPGAQAMPMRVTCPIRCSMRSAAR